MGTIQARVDELIAQMTPAEKAGQLTQYFYFRLPADADRRRSTSTPTQQPKMVEAALREGGAGSLLFVTDPAEINRLQRLAVEGNRLGIPLLFGFDVIHGLRTILPGADRDGGLLGSRDDRARPGGRRPRGARGRHPLDVRADGRHRPRSTLGPDHRGRRRGSVPRRRRGGRPGARLPGRRAGCAGARHRRPEALRRLRRRARRARLRRGQPVRLRAVERLLPAVQGGGRGRRRQRDDRLHGPQRHPGDRQSVAVHRGAARHLGLRGLRGQRRQRRAQPASPTASRPT